MGIQIDPDFDLHLHRECGGDTSWVAGYLYGALDAFSLMGMAFAIRDTYCSICRECGYVAHNEPSCQCWNDE